MNRDGLAQFASIIASLNVLRFQPLNESEMEVYASVLARAPLPLIEAASASWLTTHDKFPTPHQLLEACERVRLAKFQLLRESFPPCGNCSADGWMVIVRDGVERMARCECRKAYQVACEHLGWPREPLALPAPEHDDA